jgi:hypothetical protein
MLVESVTVSATAAVAVSVVTLAGSEGSAPAGATTRTKIARASPGFNVTEDVPHTIGVSVPDSRRLPVFGVTYEERPPGARWPTRDAAQPAVAGAVSM